MTTASHDFEENPMQTTESDIARLLEFVTTLESTNSESDPAGEATREVMKALFSVPKHLRDAMQLTKLACATLDSLHTPHDEDPYPSLAASWDCGPTAVAAGIDRLVVAALAADHCTVLACIDEIYTLVILDLPAQCGLRDQPHNHPSYSPVRTACGVLAAGASPHP